MKREEQAEEWEEKQVKEIYKVVEDNPRVILTTELTVLKQISEKETILTRQVI